MLPFDDLTPQEAAEEKYKSFVQDLNKRKNKSSNHYFEVGHLVRKKKKLLAKPTFAKGYKQTWTTGTHTLKVIHGVNGILDNGHQVKLNNLQVISTPKETKPDDDQPIHKVERQAKIDKVLKSIGVDQDNVIRSKKKTQRIF
jgi:hypothetical protein